MEFREVKLEIFVPEEFVVPIRDALSRVGAGKIGSYDHCVSVSKVSGYWRPLDGAQPYQGTAGEICSGEESKMEIRCRRELAANAVRVIKSIHPYEEPVINILPLVNDLFDRGNEG